jgi:hypothetical protein
MKKLKKSTKRDSKKSKKNILHMRRIKNNILEKFFIESPYNTNDFLIRNNSTPFYDENEEEYFNFPKPELININLDNEIQNLIHEKIESTNEESDMDKETKENTKKSQNDKKFSEPTKNK